MRKKQQQRVLKLVLSLWATFVCLANFADSAYLAGLASLAGSGSLAVSASNANLMNQVSLVYGALNLVKETDEYKYKLQGEMSLD